MSRSSTIYTVIMVSFAAITAYMLAAVGFITYKVHLAHSLRTLGLTPPSRRRSSISRPLSRRTEAPLLRLTSLPTPSLGAHPAVVLLGND